MSSSGWRPERRQWLGVLCFLGLVFAGAGAVRAQVSAGEPGASANAFVARGLGMGTVAVGGAWKFHTGDEMAWAAPGFDDSGWESIDVSRPWGEQGHWAYAGHAWYRREITFESLPATLTELAVFVPETVSAYEVYWNGRKIGSTDDMPAPVMVNQSVAMHFAMGRPESGVLAFRVATTPLDSTSPGNSFGLAVPRVGGAEAIANLAAARRAAAVRAKLLEVVQIVLYGQLFVLGVWIWLRHRGQKLLFWISVFLAASALWTALDPILFPWLLTSAASAAFYGPTFHSFVDIALWYLLLYLLELDRHPKVVHWTRILAWITFCSAIGDGLAFLLPYRDAHALLFEVLDAIATFGFSFPAVLPLFLIGIAIRRRMDPARRIVAIAAFVSDMYFVLHHTAVQGERFTRLTFGDTMMSPMFTVDGVEVTMPAVLSLVLVYAIVYAVYRYMVAEGKRRAALVQDYHNARAVQQVLIPHEVPRVAGFAIDSVYKPFGEVGGDFFQIVALQDGGLLAAIGDVSGKGMQAAMTVAVLVGAMGTLAQYTDNPGEILEGMNERMIGRSHGGFTTCLVLRLDADGTLTAANAGHIGPYVGGEELVLENGLPLGIAAGATYAEAKFTLAPGGQLTLVTDGVVEARDAHGTLFGFERTARMSVQSAEMVASAAEAYGQDDDITVLTLTRVGAERKTAQESAAPVLSPA